MVHKSQSKIFRSLCHMRTIYDDQFGASDMFAGSQLPSELRVDIADYDQSFSSKHVDRVLTSTDSFHIFMF